MKFNPEKDPLESNPVYWIFSRKLKPYRIAVIIVLVVWGLITKFF